MRVRLGRLTITVALNESATAAALYEAAPFEAAGYRWGQEIYFATGVCGEGDEATSECVARGDVGYWPPGQALCLFWGPTPLSVGEEIRPASAVAVVGRMEAEEGHYAALDEVIDGVAVTVERSD